MNQKYKELKLEGDDSIINWKLIAEPQADLYDSLVVLKFAGRHKLLNKNFDENSTFLTDQVKLCRSAISPFPSYCIPAPFDHPNIKKGCELLHLWTTVLTQFQLLTESVSPFINTKNSSRVSYSFEGGGFGKIAATIDEPVAFAECLVHEMAHHKLRALGVEIESATRIIKNPSEQKFQSPIVYDCLRPMSAVLHAQYAFTYIAALNIEILSSSEDREIVERCTSSLARVLPRLEFGDKIIKDNAEVDRVGADFLEGFFAWLDRVIQKGYNILDTFQICPLLFIHPLVPIERHNNSIELPKYISARPLPMKNIENYSLGDEMILYLPISEKGISLNSSAKKIWELCDGKYTIFEIAQILGQRLGVCENEPLQHELLQDVVNTVIQLCQLELLELEKVTCAKSV